VKAIIEAHRGSVEVESEPGVGTTFKVLLPIISEGKIADYGKN
jgi:signal transduction histidine kinase